jgi:hypothetical protein
MMDIKRKISTLDDQTNIFLDNIIYDKNENLNNEKDILKNEDDIIIKKKISSNDLFNYFVKKEHKDNNDSSDEEDTEDEDEDAEDAEDTEDAEEAEEEKEIDK